MSNNIDNSLGERIKKNRQSEGMTITDLCRRAVISRPYYYNIEKGISTPSREVIDKIASALNVSANILLSDGIVSSNNPNVKLKEKRIAKTTDVIRIPIIGEVREDVSMFAAGNIEGYTVHDIRSLKSDKTYFAYKASDASMSYSILKEDVVIVEITSVVQNNDIVIALLNNNEVEMKRIRYSGETIILIPENEEPLYKTKYFPIDKIKVIGKVVKSERIFKSI